LGLRSKTSLPIEKQTLRPVIEAAFEKGGLDAVCDLVVTLLNEQETRFEQKIAKLEKRIAELERNSRTSSKPPSSDKGNFSNPPKPKPKSLRQKSTRKSGGQKGHPGSPTTASTMISHLEAPVRIVEITSLKLPPVMMTGKYDRSSIYHPSH